jgi:hypothetical protein
VGTEKVPAPTGQPRAPADAETVDREAFEDVIRRLVTTPPKKKRDAE